MSASNHPIVIVNQTLHRLPLILDVLEEIEAGAKSPGDKALRLGCQKAVQGMIEGLKRIPPRHTDKGAEPPAREVQIASAWLLGERPRRFLPRALHDELMVLIEAHLPQAREALSSQSRSPK